MLNKVINQKKKVYIIHGYGANVNSNWYPQVAKELDKNGVEVSILEMPKRKSPSAEAWIGKLNLEIKELNENVYLVGHSLGTITILIYLSELKKISKIGGIVLVAPFDEDIPVFKALPKFLKYKIDYNKIIKNTNLRAVIAAKNDLVVPYELSEKVVQSMQAKFYSFEEGGHFGEPDGITELPIVSEIILGELEKSCKSEK